MKYLLDTNVCIALMKTKSVSVRERFEREMSGGSAVFISSIVIFELWYGVSKSTQQEKNAQRLAELLSGRVSVLPFDEEDARFAGQMRADTESIGRPIGNYDLLIAGQALRHGMTLVSANAKEFGRIKDLRWENWSMP